ncbi:hypothetical protein MES4922_370046 [Mesorhizobium ventifaucium]|uniref:IGFBP N-terminal domain-containing protein n=1 Tax=Mesorhizobium ventifaucium TaxID=666020 RepID=A0ABN8K841_9HYPH|nr:hypothetical protein MES4922_370046 [Mesorhizobium ventifaucium]
MRAQRFDDLCRVLAVPASRRRVMEGLVWTLGGGAALWLVGPGTRPAFAQAAACRDGAAVLCSQRVWQNVTLEIIKICAFSVITGPYTPVAFNLCILGFLGKAWLDDKRCREDECLQNGGYGGECLSDSTRPAPTDGSEKTGTCCPAGMRASGGVCYPPCPACQEGDGPNCKPCGQCKTCRGGLLGELAGTTACLSVDKNGIAWKICGATCCPAGNYCCNNTSCCTDPSKCCGSLIKCMDANEQCCGGGTCDASYTCCETGICCNTKAGFECAVGSNGLPYCD